MLSGVEADCVSHYGQVAPDGRVLGPLGTSADPRYGDGGDHSDDDNDDDQLDQTEAPMLAVVTKHNLIPLSVFPSPNDTTDAPSIGNGKMGL